MSTPGPNIMRALAAASVLLAFTPFLAAPATAHGVVGNRFFPATLTVDDPFVADELSLPTISTLKGNASGDEPATRETEIEAEFAKRITNDLGFEISDAYRILSPSGGERQYGFGNVELALKYQFFKSEEHEAVASAGLGFEIGGTGKQRVEADRFNTLTPAVFFGKGFGDLPDSAQWLKPFAVTGVAGITFPFQTGTRTTTLDEDTGEFEVETERHPNTLQYGFTLQYSLPYLQANVRDVGLGGFLGRIIPVVEFAFETDLNRGTGGRTTGTISPGVLWLGQSVQLGLEAILPVNDSSGRGVGVIAQLHFYLDDLFPRSLGRPLLGGEI
jgi:hypothetical protein